MHAAFRRDLRRFDAALGAFPDGSASRAEELGRAWDFLEEEVHHHHGYEEQFFWPALQQTDADLSALVHLDAQHNQMRRALAEASSAVAVLRADPVAAQAAPQPVVGAASPTIPPSGAARPSPRACVTPCAGLTPNSPSWWCTWTGWSSPDALWQVER